MDVCDVTDVPTKQRSDPQTFCISVRPEQNEALNDSELSSCKIDYAMPDAEFIGYRHNVTHHPTYHKETPTEDGTSPGWLRLMPETFPQFPGTQPPPVSQTTGSWPPQMFPQPRIGNPRGFSPTLQVGTPLLIPP